MLSISLNRHLYIGLIFSKTVILNKQDYTHKNLGNGFVK